MSDSRTAPRSSRRQHTTSPDRPHHLKSAIALRTYIKVAFAKLYDRRPPIIAADLLNDRVLPFFDAHEVKLCRVLTDRGTEYCRNPNTMSTISILAVEDVDHTRTKTKGPQTTDVNRAEFSGGWLA